MYAFVLISLDSAREQDILQELANMKEIKEAHILFGEWDMLAKVELESPEALGTFVMNEIRNVPGVKLTSTLIVAR